MNLLELSEQRREIAADDRRIAADYLKAGDDLRAEIFMLKAQIAHIEADAAMLKHALDLVRPPVPTKTQAQRIADLCAPDLHRLAVQLSRGLITDEDFAREALIARRKAHRAVFATDGVCQGVPQT